MQPASWVRPRAFLAADTTPHSVDHNLLACVYQRLCRWFASKRRFLHRDFRRASQAGLNCEQSPDSPVGNECPQLLASASSDDSGVDTSTCSSLTSPAASTISGDPSRPCADTQHTVRIDKACANATNIRTDACCTRTHLTPTLSCPANRTISSTSVGRERETLCATWPSSGKSMTIDGKHLLISMAFSLYPRGRHCPPSPLLPV